MPVPIAIDDIPMVDCDHGRAPVLGLRVVCARIAALVERSLDDPLAERAASRGSLTKRASALRHSSR